MKAAKRNCRQDSNIDDLPDPLLVEILCRLPSASAVHQCKFVSKHWCSLISDPYFLRRFICFQSHQQKPITRTLIFSDTPIQNKFLSMSSSEPEPEPGTDNWPDFSFLPCFQSPSVIEGNEPVVLGSFNDLVLCSATKYFQHDYYICNPCTKKWVHLPPIDWFQKIRVGFICEPFYKEVDVGEKGQERNFELDFEYTYMVVRLVSVYPEESTSDQFRLDVFCSVTASWLEAIVYSPKSFHFDSLVDDIGISYKGILYWWSREGFLIGFDIYSNINNYIFFCSFIDKPQRDPIGGNFEFLGICRGRMRLCQLFSITTGITFLSIWELREDEIDRWCLIDTLPIEDMLSKDPSRDWKFKDDLVVKDDTVMVLGFDPNNEDILILQVCQHIFMCNIRTESATVTGTTSYKGKRSVFPLVLPWWPTPVPRLDHACPIYDMLSLF